jgi:nitrite reductase/ring-hydroxylating ferredoxin subunit
MSIRSSRLVFTLIFTGVLVAACNRDLTDDPIPYIIFPSATLNLGFPEYLSLAQDGGHKTISSISGVSIGVRGVIIYRKSSTQYNAFEVNCSYHPNEANANVSVHSSGLFLTCTGCGSNFNLSDGAPSGGIAWRPLRRYRTELSGSYLTITSDVAN